MEPWQKIIQKHGPTVWSVAWRLLGNEADAADCFQDTFMSAVDIARRQVVRNWGGLLRRLATLRALDRLRLRRRHEEVCCCPPDWTLFSGHDIDPHEAAAKAELVERVRSALAFIPDDQAEVFCMRYLGEMSYQEIAQATGKEPNAVGVLLHRAREKLRAIMTNTAESGRVEPATGEPINTEVRR